MRSSIAPYLTDGPEQRQVILLKLSYELENAPEFPNQRQYHVASAQRQWLARVGALMERMGLSEGVQFRSSYSLIEKFGNSAIENVKGHVVDAVEKLRLELQLNGREEFGSVYESGELFKFFSDLQGIVRQAQRSLYIVDPYFNGQAFSDIVGPTEGRLEVRILCERYAREVQSFASRFALQYEADCNIRTSREAHDRLVIVDAEDCWIVGSSIKDGGKKPTYLVPLSPVFTPRKVAIYENIWERAGVL